MEGQFTFRLMSPELEAALRAAVARGPDTLADFARKALAKFLKVDLPPPTGRYESEGEEPVTDRISVRLSAPLRNAMNTCAASKGWTPSEVFRAALGQVLGIEVHSESEAQRAQEARVVQLLTEEGLSYAAIGERIGVTKQAVGLILMAYCARKGLDLPTLVAEARAKRKATRRAPALVAKALGQRGRDVPPVVAEIPSAQAAIRRTEASEDRREVARKAREAKEDRVYALAAEIGRLPAAKQMGLSQIGFDKILRAARLRHEPNRPPRTILSPEVRAAHDEVIARLHKSGMTMEEIGAELGLNRKTVSLALKRASTDADATSPKRPAKPAPKRRKPAK